MLLQGRTMIGPQFEGSQPMSRKILLMAQILVADDEEVEPRGFSSAKQVPFSNSPQPIFTAV